jgi:hypothetical protein
MNGPLIINRKSALILLAGLNKTVIETWTLDLWVELLLQRDGEREHPVKKKIGSLEKNGRTENGEKIWHKLIWKTGDREQER